MRNYVIIKGEIEEGYLGAIEYLKKQGHAQPILWGGGKRIGELIKEIRSGESGRAATAYLLGYDDIVLRRALEQSEIEVRSFLGNEFVTPESEFRSFAASHFGFGSSSTKTTSSNKVKERIFSTGRHKDAVTNDPDLVLRLYGGSRPGDAEAPDSQAASGTASAKAGNPNTSIYLSVFLADGVEVTQGFTLSVPTDAGNRHLITQREIAKTAESMGLAPRFRRDHDNLLLAVESMDPVSPEEARKQLDQLIDSALNALLLGARPISAGRTSFIAMISDADGDLKRKIEERASAKPQKLPPFTLIHENDQEKEKLLKDYFLPEVYETLIEAKQGFKSYEVDISGNVFIDVEHGNYGGKLTQKIAKVKLHCVPGETVLLEWQSECSGSTLEKSSNTLWRHYLDRKDVDAGGWSLAKLIDFNAEARLLKQDYDRKTEDKGGKETQCKSKLRFESVSRTLTDDESNLAAPLLQLIFGDGHTIENLGDSRARVITSMILDGGEPPAWASDAFEGLLSRVSAVDPYGHGYSYSDDFVKDELARASYRRFWDYGSKFMVTDHSFAFVGFRHWDRIFIETRENSKGVKEKPSFAERYIHAIHMDALYPVIYRYFLGIEANIRHVTAKLADFESNLPVKRSILAARQMQVIRDLRHDLDSLTSRLIHADISSQIQGRDLTALMHQQFRLGDSWKELDARLRLVEEQWQRIVRNREQTRSSALFYVGSALTTALGLYSLKPKTDVQGQSSGGAVSTSVSSAVEKDPLAWIWSVVETSAAGTRAVCFDAWSLPLAFLLTASSIWLVAIYLVSLVSERRATGKTEPPWRRPRRYLAAKAWVSIAAGVLVSLWALTLGVGLFVQHTPVENYKAMTLKEKLPAGITDE